MNPFDLLIAPAYAQAAGAAPAGGAAGLTTFIFPLVIVGLMYFMLIRPQSKRMKEHRAMLDKLAVGDEVIVGGGIAGVVRDLGDGFVTVEIADKVQVKVQKGAIANVLPKGTLKSV
jgi:preprotein translocase subunit YajC